MELECFLTHIGKDSGIPIGFLVLKNENPTKKIQQIKMSDVVGQTTFNAFRESINF